MGERFCRLKWHFGSHFWPTVQGVETGRCSWYGKNQQDPSARKLPRSIAFWKYHTGAAFATLCWFRRLLRGWRLAQGRLWRFASCGDLRGHMLRTMLGVGGPAEPLRCCGFYTPCSTPCILRSIEPGYIYGVHSGCNEDPFCWVTTLRFKRSTLRRRQLHASAGQIRLTARLDVIANDSHTPPRPMIGSTAAVHHRVQVPLPSNRISLRCPPSSSHRLSTLLSRLPQPLCCCLHHCQTLPAPHTTPTSPRANTTNRIPRRLEYPLTYDH